MKKRKYDCHICHAKVTKAESFLVETPCDLDKHPKGIGRSRVCKTHHGVEAIALQEETTAEE